MWRGRGDRLEKTWNQRFGRGGNGRVIVAESALNVDVLSTRLADVAALAEAGAIQADIANAFGIPLAFLSTETNPANLVAAERQHAAKFRGCERTAPSAGPQRRPPTSQPVKMTRP